MLSQQFIFQCDALRAARSAIALSVKKGKVRYVLRTAEHHRY
jgi:hypothetical protein